MSKDLTTENPDVAAGCFGIILVFLLSPFATLWNAYVMLQNYNWFLASIANFPVLHLTNFIGVSLIANMLLVHLAKSESKTDVEKKGMTNIIVGAIAKMFLYPLAFLFFGWLYHALFVR